MNANPQSQARTSPLVSVIVLHYKRRDALETVVRSVLMQDYENFELIVVDNHSEDDSEPWLKTLDPRVRYVGLAENLGPGGGRNAGLQAARGEYIITIDNDVSFATGHEISSVCEAFARNPSYHVLAFRICDVNTGALRDREWCHPRPWREWGEREFETNFFGEGASAYRREVFATAGNYFAPLFIGHEGLDLVLRILDHGYRVLYCPSVSVIHSMSTETRTPERPFYFYTRNYIWIAYKDYNFVAGLRFLLPKLAMMSYFTLRSGHFRAFGRGIYHGVVGLRQIQPHRTPVRNTTVRYYADLNKTRPSWLTRFMRHRSAPQL